MSFDEFEKLGREIKRLEEAIASLRGEGERLEKIIRETSADSRSFTELLMRKAQVETALRQAETQLEDARKRRDRILASYAEYFPQAEKEYRDAVEKYKRGVEKLLGQLEKTPRLVDEVLEAGRVLENSRIYYFRLCGVLGVEPKVEDIRDFASPVLSEFKDAVQRALKVLREAGVK